MSNGEWLVVCFSFSITEGNGSVSASQCLLIAERTLPFQKLIISIHPHLSSSIFVCQVLKIAQLGVDRAQPDFVQGAEQAVASRRTILGLSLIVSALKDSRHKRESALTTPRGMQSCSSESGEASHPPSTSTTTAPTSPTSIPPDFTQHSKNGQLGQTIPLAWHRLYMF